jgi:hypothetical protein
MRLPTANMAATGTTVTLPTSELCPGCRSRAMDLRVGPFTPAEFALISPTVEPPPDPISLDPDVVAAQQAALDARASWEKANLVWEEALIAHREARLRSNGDDTDARHFRLAALEAAVVHAEEERDAVHETVVAANVAVREAQQRARQWVAGPVPSRE